MPLWKKMKLKQDKKTAKGLLKYVFKEKDAELLLTHNLTGDTITEWVAQFEQQFDQWDTKKSKSAQVHHEVISFSTKEDKNALTREFFLDIGEKIVDLRGVDGMHVLVVHKSKKHWHLHNCVSSSSILTNRELRVGGDQFINIRIELENYIRREYPEIKHSFAYDISRKKKLT